MATPAHLTTFTPPPNCLPNTYRYGANQLVGPMTSTCFPSGWTNTSTTYYSPGACPSGYTTACITPNTAGSVTETAATCCPSSFICASSGNTLGCRSTIIGGKDQLMTIMDASFVSPSKTSMQNIGGNVNANGVQVRFQATDLISPTSTENSGPTSSNSPPTSTPSPGLSSGAKAGIGVGAALGGLIFLVAFFLGWRYMRSRRNANSARHGGQVTTGDTESKVYADGVKYSSVPQEVGVERMRGELREQNEVRMHELYGEAR